MGFWNFLRKGKGDGRTFGNVHGAIREIRVVLHPWWASPTAKMSFLAIDSWLYAFLDTPHGNAFYVGTLALVFDPGSGFFQKPGGLSSS